MRLCHLKRVGRIEDVLSGSAPVNITGGGFTAQRLELPQHWHERVLRKGYLPRKLFEIEGGCVGASPDDLSGGSRDDTEFSLRRGQCAFDIEPRLQSGKIAPDAASLQVIPVTSDERIEHT